MSAACLLVVAVIGCGPAGAASGGPLEPDPLPATPLAIPIEPNVAYPASGTAGGYAFNLRPLGAPLGGRLADEGIYIVGRNLSEAIGSVGGGLKQGAFYEGYSALGADLDLQRIAGVAGATVHFLLSDLAGQSFAGYTGSAYANNRLYASTPAFRLNELSYEQDLFSGDADLRAGRVPAFTQFDGSELYCTFITDLCRTPAAYTFDRGSPSYLASSWAAIAEARLTRRTYIHVGVYENEPVLAMENHGGFPGRDWGLNYADGATIPLQLGYRTTTANDRLPRAYSIGGFYNTARYADPLLNAAGRNRILAGGATGMDDDSSIIYVQGQQMVYRPSRSDRGITLFGGADWATSGQPAIERMIFGGAFWKGPFPSRPEDTFGVAVTYTAVNSRITERVDDTLLKGTRGQASRGEVSYQANYGYRLAPGLTIKPFVDVISHPDQATFSDPRIDDPYSVQVGTLLQIELGPLLGLPSIGRQPSSTAVVPG